MKLVIKDLVSYDGLKLELQKTEELLKLSNNKIVLKDNIISNLNEKVINLQTIITKKDEQFSLEREKSESLLKELKQEKQKGFFYKLGAIGGLAIGVFFAVSK